MKRNLNYLEKLFLLLFLASIPNVYSHNFFNGGCVHHCENNLERGETEKKLINAKERKQINSYNSCLKKSLCRG